MTAAYFKMGDNDVMIKVVVTAINRLDCNQRAGKLPVPPGVTGFGLEVAGVIVGKARLSAQRMH